MRISALPGAVVPFSGLWSTGRYADPGHATPCAARRTNRTLSQPRASCAEPHSFTTTKDSAPLFGVEAGTQVAGSFIDQEVFERWQAAHPDWRVVEEGDLVGGAARRMIEVPVIALAGFEVGPVWFSERPKGTFPQWMSSMMDREVWGALGGSGLRYFRVVVDYPGSRACFGRAGSVAG